MEIKLVKQENLSGDASRADQGFGCVASEQPPRFDPHTQTQAAYDFFAETGFVVLSDCLNAGEVSHLNEFYDRTQKQYPERWGIREKPKTHHRNQGLIYSQPLLDHPELDPYTQHPRSYPVVCEILGGEEYVRFSEFNFREAPRNAGVGAMNFHHDAVRPDRLIRKPYMPVDWLCAVHYLTDVTVKTPSFCVVPGSNRYSSLQEAYEGLGDSYQEIPIRGEAGTCVLYDTATFHTRYDGDGIEGRRTWHQYYARGGFLKSSLPTTDRYVRPPTPVLTDWNVFPERLALHEDPVKRRFFSHWNTAQCEWVASGFSDEVRNAMPRGHE